MASTCSTVLPLPKIDLRHAVAHGPVMVDLGEAEIFKWQVAQMLERRVNRCLSLADFFEQRA